MVKVKGTRKCEQCIYWSGWALGCNYLTEEKRSRLIDENGNRYDPDYCDKFKAGKKKQGQQWIEMRMGRYK